MTNIRYAVYKYTCRARRGPMTAPHDNLRGENIEPNEEEIVHRIAVSD